jgi:hypothetical protein
MMSLSLFQDVIVNANELQAFYVTMMATNSYLYYGANKTSDNAQSIIAQNDEKEWLQNWFIK